MNTAAPKVTNPERNLLETIQRAKNDVSRVQEGDDVVVQRRAISEVVEAGSILKTSLTRNQGETLAAKLTSTQSDSEEKAGIKERFIALENVLNFNLDSLKLPDGDLKGAINLALMSTKDQAVNFMKGFVGYLQSGRKLVQDAIEMPLGKESVVAKFANAASSKA